MFVSARPIPKTRRFQVFPPVDGPEKELDPIGPEEKQMDGARDLT
jgi:hypothetical protein